MSLFKNQQIHFFNGQIHIFSIIDGFGVMESEVHGIIILLSVDIHRRGV